MIDIELTGERWAAFLLGGEAHHSVLHLVRCFKFRHLPPHLQLVSARFADLAITIAEGPANIETSVALRKLLESKDAAVRAVALNE